MDTVEGKGEGEPTKYPTTEDQPIKQIPSYVGTHEVKSMSEDEKEKGNVKRISAQFDERTKEVEIASSHLPNVEKKLSQKNIPQLSKTEIPEKSPEHTTAPNKPEEQIAKSSELPPSVVQTDSTVKAALASARSKLEDIKNNLKDPSLSEDGKKEILKISDDIIKELKELDWSTLEELKNKLKDPGLSEDEKNAMLKKSDDIIKELKELDQKSPETWAPRSFM